MQQLHFDLAVDAPIGPVELDESIFDLIAGGRGFGIDPNG